MTNKHNKKATDTVALPKMNTRALKGKQSVRTSFKLTQGCIQAINIVAKQLGIKHRSLFDFLVEDLESLEVLAREIVANDANDNKGIPKSFIISRDSLLAIDHLCDKLDISKDALIELSVRRLLPIIEKEIESHRKRKEILAIVENHYQASRTILDQIKKSVGAEDPVYGVYQSTVSTYKQAKTLIRKIISKGRVIEDFDPNSLKD